MNKGDLERFGKGIAPIVGLFLVGFILAVIAAEGFGLTLTQIADWVFEDKEVHFTMWSGLAWAIRSVFWIFSLLCPGFVLFMIFTFYLVRRGRDGA